MEIRTFTASAAETVEPQKPVRRNTAERERGGKNRCGFQSDYHSAE